ncbi:MAG: tail fiber domain-containing protein [Armatimonadetes bacterium]|nr:tail fiber domain-containing protein [Armatimonadota bacterium]
MEATTSGTGNAGVFSITNTSSGGTALRVFTLGTGRAIHAATTNSNAHAAYLDGKVQIVNGQFTPAVGSSAGIVWPDNLGNLGDYAHMRYFVRSGTATTLQIATGSDFSDDIRFSVNGADTLVVKQGRVGINNSSPNLGIDIVQSGYGFSHSHSSADVSTYVHHNGSYRGIGSYALVPFRLLVGNIARVDLSTDGTVGLGGVTNATYQLELPNMFNIYGMGRANSWVTYSSSRWKEDIRSIETPLDLISRLEGVRYRWKEENGGTEDFGFIAEEVAKVLPEIVRMEEDGEYAMGMDYSRIVPLLVESVKLLKQDNSELREMLLKALAEIERIKTGK